MLALTACGSTAKADVAAPTTGAVTTAAAPATTAAAAQATTAAPAVKKVDANSASKDELIAAIESVGVKNAAKFADELIEYRPYAKNDASFPTVSKELAKYNASPEDITKIISVLHV